MQPHQIVQNATPLFAGYPGARVLVQVGDPLEFDPHTGRHRMRATLEAQVFATHSLSSNPSPSQRLGAIVATAEIGDLAGAERGREKAHGRALEVLAARVAELVREST